MFVYYDIAACEPSHQIAVSSSGMFSVNIVVQTMEERALQKAWAPTSATTVTTLQDP